MQKKILKKIFWLLFMLVIPVLTYFSYSFWADILSEVFSPSKDNIIYIWDNKNDVWHAVLRQSTVFERWTGFYQRAPLLVRIVKIILRLTIVLSVTMIIFYGVKFMIQVFNGSDYKSAGAKKDLINVFVWLLIALFSVTAVNLVVSIPKSSMTTSEDLNASEIWCRINGNLYWWLEFREYICKNLSIGYSDEPSARSWQYIRALSNWPDHMDDRLIWAYRCRVIEDSGNWKWIRIKNNTIQSSCSQLWWQIVGG